MLCLFNTRGRSSLQRAHRFACDKCIDIASFNEENSLLLLRDGILLETPPYPGFRGVILDMLDGTVCETSGGCCFRTPFHDNKSIVVNANRSSIVREPPLEFRIFQCLSKRGAPDWVNAIILYTVHNLQVMGRIRSGHNLEIYFIPFKLTT